MKKVYVGMSADLLHTGHIRALEWWVYAWYDFLENHKTKLAYEDRLIGFKRSGRAVV